jgi:probable DNA repair protein
MPLPDPIRDALERGATIVTASPRAARNLHLAYAAQQRESNHEVWPTPHILGWETWMRELWRIHSFFDTDAPLLLTSLQERTLWKRAQENDAALVISSESLAALAQEAYGLLCAYEAHSSRNFAWEQLDAERFRHWTAVFEEECRRKHWMSVSRLETTLAGKSHPELPRELVLAGFDHITPAQHSLLNAWKEHGMRVLEFHPESVGTQPLWISAIDRREEMTACARWIREELSENAHSRIGIIVQDIEGTRGEIERIFRRILMPESKDILSSPATMPFEFSLGLPLAQAHVIRAALLLLRWIVSPLREEDISWLTLSGFFANDSELFPLARLDAKLRSSGSPSPELSFESYLSSIRSMNYSSLQDFHLRLQALVKMTAANAVSRQSRTYSAWIDLAQIFLKASGWPGTRVADSYQFQAQERWDHLLDEIALLDFDQSTVSFGEFIRLLEQQANETVFAPESHDAPAQILGPLESSGQLFSAIWFLGTDDNHWPMRARPHPLLPLTIQKQYRMPHATQESDWNLAQAITQRFLRSAPQVIFSYAQSDKDGELRFSPMIAALFAPGARPQRNMARRQGETEPFFPSLERISDASGTLPWPREQTAGGSEVLRSQAACPFQAFATKRLRAEPLNSKEWGLSASERGNLLHKVLDRVWSGPEFQSLRTSEDLTAAIAEHRLREILDRNITAVFSDLLRAHAGDIWMQSYLALEQERLRLRLEEWLMIEARRLPFTVEAREQELRGAHVGDLRLNLRADRIDLLPDGSRFLIDYKTGEVSTSAWRGDRPEEPQLPLYAVYGHVENVSGLLFAQIRAGNLCFHGRVRDALVQLDTNLKPSSPMVREPYSQEMRSNWENILQNLADDFLQGIAVVDPHQGHKGIACKYCALPGLCRIAEQQREQITPEDEERDNA